MIEVIQTYDLLPTADLAAYAGWAKRTAQAVLEQPGIKELRAHRNILGNPQIRTTTVWDSISDWARFADKAWQEMERELSAFAVNYKVELWRPSPILPEPLRPSSK